MKMKKLTKSTNKVVSGVIGGFADYLGFDATILRIIFVVFIFIADFGFVSALILYILLAAIMPKPDKNATPMKSKRQNRNVNVRPRKDAEKIDNEDDWSDF